ncbi:WD40-repeat-containing domain protein [Ganoderma leucocontextum]|nr:WD40-repeat-containing domain protein [Ganoderma leucocontextum]
MPKRYQEFRRLTNGHSRGITTVSFSAEGTFVATGGLDGKVCIWGVQDGRLLHCYTGQTSILCLEWMPSREDALLCGSQDGNVTLTYSAQYAIIVNGFWAHKYPVECIAIADHYIATGAHRELTVWKWNNSSRRFHRVKNLQEPPTGSHNQHQEVLVTSIHWTPASTTASSMLMVSYMYHGIQFVSSSLLNMICRAILSSASTSLSVTGEYLAISNLDKGFDVYEMATEVLHRSFEHDVGEPYPTPVRFIHGGSVIAGGSTVGKVDLWHLRLGKMPSLLIPSARTSLS